MRSCTIVTIPTTELFNTKLLKPKKSSTKAKKSNRVTRLNKELWQQIQGDERIVNILQMNFSNPLILSERLLFELYHIDRGIAQRLIAQTEKLIPTRKIPLAIRVFGALYYFAHGNFQARFDRIFSNKQMNNVLLVANAIQKLTPLHIKFPGTASYGPIKENFLKKTDFPDCIGSLDCTKIRIKQPRAVSKRKAAYLNNDGNYSMNLQLITDYRLKILHAECSHTGATNDCNIFDNGCLNETLRKRYKRAKIDNGDTFILADSRYNPRPWLVVPYYPAVEPDDALHNHKHARARNCSYRVMHTLKTNFKCLRFLGVNPEGAQAIIETCIILHNMMFDRALLRNNYPDRNTMQYMSNHRPPPINPHRVDFCQIIDGYLARNRATAKIVANQQRK